MRTFGLLKPVGLLLALSVLALAAPQQPPYDSPPINYRASQPTDRVADLEAQITAGSSELSYESNRGYLKSFLAALEIPVSSQSLVFSKTSFQLRKINPRSPRAIYFNDDVYVGWVQGGEVLEIASVDPQLGSIFYTLAQVSERPVRITRQTDNCLQCHDSSSLTLGVPGLTIRSVFPGGDGMPHFNRGGFRTTYRSPIAERWGGWYVTGEHGTLRHLGNVCYPDDPNADLARLGDRGSNLTDLAARIEVEPYLTDTSDIVALMVLEYQTHVQNLIIRANHESRLAILQSDEINCAMGSPLRPLTEGSQRRIGYACAPLVEALLYSGEAPLGDRMKGNSTFAADFEKRGPFDSRGRSLRQFDLKSRMFKYPLSYLIYSKSFAGLPPDARDHVSLHLGQILKGPDPGKGFEHLTPELRRALREIIDETLPDLSRDWK
jgi:hypothetical protein